MVTFKLLSHSVGSLPWDHPFYSNRAAAAEQIERCSQPEHRAHRQSDTIKEAQLKQNHVTRKNTDSQQFY